MARGVCIGDREQSGHGHYGKNNASLLARLAFVLLLVLTPLPAGLLSCAWSGIVEPEWLKRASTDVIYCINGGEVHSFCSIQVNEFVGWLTVIAGGPLPSESSDDYIVRLRIILDPKIPANVTFAADQINLTFDDKAFVFVSQTGCGRSAGWGNYYEVELQCEACGALWFNTNGPGLEDYDPRTNLYKARTGHRLFLDLSEAIRWNDEPIEINVIELLDPRPWYDQKEQLIERAAAVADTLMSKKGYVLDELERSFTRVNEYFVFSYTLKSIGIGGGAIIKIDSRTLKVVSTRFEQ